MDPSPPSLIQDLVHVIEAGGQEDLPSLQRAATQLCRCVASSVEGAPHSAASVALMCAVKAKPQLFRDTTTILPIIIDWLRPTESSRSANAQRAGFLLHRLACNVLLRAFRDCPQWPLALLQVYMEDALGPRAWVDEHEDYGCRTFIANLQCQQKKN